MKAEILGVDGLGIGVGVRVVQGRKCGSVRCGAAACWVGDSRGRGSSQLGRASVG